MHSGDNPCHPMCVDHLSSPCNLANRRPNAHHCFQPMSSDWMRWVRVQPQMTSQCWNWTSRTFHTAEVQLTCMVLFCGTTNKLPHPEEYSEGLAATLRFDNWLELCSIVLRKLLCFNVLFCDADSAVVLNSLHELQHKLLTNCEAVPIAFTFNPCHVGLLEGSLAKFVIPLPPQRSFTNHLRLRSNFWPSRVTSSNPSWTKPVVSHQNYQSSHTACASAQTSAGTKALHVRLPVHSMENGP